MTRQEAREHIKGRMELYIHSTLDNFALHKALEALEQPERKNARWVSYLKEGLKWKCSECGSRFTTPFHYCPHCGAKMEEQDG